MTDERAEQNRLKSERLFDIIVWSFQNPKAWIPICHGALDTTLAQMGNILNQLVHYGFMELYYFMLSQLAFATEVSITSEPEVFLCFLKSCLEDDLTLDVEKALHKIQANQTHQ